MGGPGSNSSNGSNDGGATTEGRSICFLLLFFAIATLFQLYHGGDMMYEMRRRKSEPTLLLT